MRRLANRATLEELLHQEGIECTEEEFLIFSLLLAQLPRGNIEHSPQTLFLFPPILWMVHFCHTFRGALNSDSTDGDSG